MSLEAYAQQIIDLTRQHGALASPIAFALAFGESLAFISLLVPAWTVLVAIGALVGVSGIGFWPIWIAISMGAALGDLLSYWIGLKLGKSCLPHVAVGKSSLFGSEGETFVKKWGVFGIFVGRFFGPLRSIVPLVAGIFVMPYWPFQFANFASALVWATVILHLGKLGSKVLIWLWE